MTATFLTCGVIPDRFRHGFSTRMEDGGGGDIRRRLSEAFGLQDAHFASQVHGARVVRVRAGDPCETTAREEADALCTGDRDVGVGVVVADCVPVLIADERTGACAALHAGWRGTVHGVLVNAVRALVDDLGSRPSDLKVALGPAIGPCCFEVGPEVVAAFAEAMGSAPGVVIERRGSKPHVDLWLALRLQAERAGVPARAVEARPECTKCDPERRFASYRRDGRIAGRQVGIVARV